MSDTELMLLRMEEAGALCDQQTDLAVQQLLRRLMTGLLLARMRDKIAPETDVDVLFVLQAALPVFQDKDSLSQILDGEDLNMFPEVE